MTDPVAALLGLDGIETSIKHTIDTVALAAANGGDVVRAGAIRWFRQELIDGLPGNPSSPARTWARSSTVSPNGS